MSKLEYRDSFDPVWNDKIMELHNKTEMKRPVDIRDRLIRADQEILAIISCWSHNVEH